MERLTLFELLGRDVGMFAFMRKFYRRVCVDPRISYRYDSKNLPALQRQFKAGLTKLLKDEGCEAVYEWGFEEEEFMHILGHMMAVVRETYLPAEDITRFRTVMLSTRTTAKAPPKKASTRSVEPLTEE